MQKTIVELQTKPSEIDDIKDRILIHEQQILQKKWEIEEKLRKVLAQQVQQQ